MDPLSAFLLVLVLLGPMAFTRSVFKRARANGHFVPQRQDWQQQWAAVGAAGRRLPAKVRPALASAGTRVAQRGRRDPATPRVGLFRRAVVPAGSNGRQRAQSTPPGRAPAAVPAAQPAPQPRPAQRPAAIPDPVPVPAPQEGPPMTTPTPAPAGGSAAGDFISATTRVIAEAEAGGLQSKARGGLVMGEGLKQLAAAMEQHARHLQEVGEYPAYVWEPWRQAAAMAAASATKVTEAGNAAAELARRPMGEANGQAPHRDELNRK